MIAKLEKVLSNVYQNKDQTQSPPPPQRIVGEPSFHDQFHYKRMGYSMDVM